jgi:hypothetical protein
LAAEFVLVEVNRPILKLLLSRVSLAWARPNLIFSVLGSPRPPSHQVHGLSFTVTLLVFEATQDCPVGRPNPLN